MPFPLVAHDLGVGHRLLLLVQVGLRVQSLAALVSLHARDTILQGCDQLGGLGAPSTLLLACRGLLVG